MSDLKKQVYENKSNIDRLEDLVSSFIVQTNKMMIAEREENRKFRDEMREFKDEMRDFKDEMRDFKDEMRDFKDEMREFKDEMREFKDEMREFKDEMREFKIDVKNDIKDMKKQWGQLAYKMGTLVEDIFSPSFDILIKKSFGIIPDIIDTRKKIKIGGDNLEIDILGIDKSGKRLFLCEVKANPNDRNYIKDLDKIIKKLPKFLPEYNNYKIVPIFAGLAMDKSIVNFLTKKGYYALVFRGDNLEILNLNELN